MDPIEHFIDYCYEVFDGLTSGCVHNLANLSYGNLKKKDECDKEGPFDVTFISKPEEISRETKKLKPGGVLILILQDHDGDFENITYLEEFRTTLNYRKVYYLKAVRILFIVTIKQHQSKYIADYTADYKIDEFDNRKTVVVYTFHELNESVKFFVKHGILKSPDVHFVMICNSDAKIDVPSYVTYINRPNIGYDFGGWAHAIYNLNLNLRETYDYFVMLNSSVRGPFIPPWCTTRNWTKIFTRLIDYRTKLVGTTIGIHPYLTHIQSMTMMFDRVGLDIGTQDGIFERNPIERPKHDIIMLKEIGFSQSIMKRGYKIRPIVSAYYNSPIPPISRIQTLIQFTDNSYFGTNLHPYEVVFIKDRTNINGNRDINNLTITHNLDFDRMSTLPLDFNWLSYLRLNPDVAKIYACENGCMIHWLNHGYAARKSY